MGFQNRRDFFKTSLLLTAGITGISSKKNKAASLDGPSENRMGVLVDTTVCIGCRSCEWACKTTHGLPTKPIDSYLDRSVYDKKRGVDF